MPKFIVWVKEVQSVPVKVEASDSSEAANQVEAMITQGRCEKFLYDHAEFICTLEKDQWMVNEEE